MYNQVRSSIIHKNCLDVDFKNCIVTIIIYLAEKYKLKIPNIIKYSNRENILKSIDSDRSIAKKVIISIINGGKEEYYYDKNINKFLKGIEEESKMLHEYFYNIDKRIEDNENIYNHKAKSFSRILQDYENQLLMYLYDYFSFKKIKMMSLIFDGILLCPKQQIDIFDIGNYLFNKSGIKMKVSIKPFKDYFHEFGESNIINLKEFNKNYKKKIFVNKKCIHHDHTKTNCNIIDYICSNCNLKIKNPKELVVFFHNSKGYDNAYIIDIFSKIENVQISCLAENKESFKLLTIKIPNKKYKIKIVDSLSFSQSNLNLLSDDLENKLKIVTKQHFKEKFEMVNKKLENFPYNYLTPDNLDEENLPEMKNFDNILTMKEITDEEYKELKLFYKKMGFKNLKEYLQCYLTSDITLLADVFLNFRNIIFNQFELDCCK